MRKLSAALLLIILLLFCSSAAAEDADALQYEKELIDIVEQISGVHVLIPDMIPEEIASVYYDVKPFALSSDPEEAAAQRGKLRMDLSGIYAVWERLPSGFLESFEGNLYVSSIKEVDTGDLGLGKLQIANIQSTIIAFSCAIACVVNIVGGIVLAQIEVLLDVLPERLKKAVKNEER